MTSVKSKLAVISVLLLAGLINIWIVYQPEISIRKNGAILVKPRSVMSFYLSAPEGIKSYNIRPVEMNKIVYKYINNYPSTFGIIAKNLDTGQEYFLNPDEKFNSASLYKLSVMYAIFYLDSTGKLDVNQSDILDNLEAMITYSSNEAALYLVNRYTNWEEVTQIVKSFGMTNTDLTDNTPDDTPVTTPRDIAYLLESIAENRAINEQASKKMYDLLSRQQIKDRIPYLLPQDITIAHKTGELDDVRHDVGIIEGPKTKYILILMTKDSQDPEAIKEVMANLSKDIYDFYETDKVD